MDTLHNADFKFEGEQVEGFMRAFETDFTGTCNRFIDQMFVEENVDEIVAHVRRVGCDGPHGEIGAALMRNFGEIDMPAWFRGAGVPIRAINAAAPTPTEVETNRKYADFEVKLMEGVGHYPHMTRPDAFNELMLETIAGLSGRRG